MMDDIVKSQLAVIRAQQEQIETFEKAMESQNGLVRVQKTRIQELEKQMSEISEHEHK